MNLLTDFENTIILNDCNIQYSMLSGSYNFIISINKKDIKLFIEIISKMTLPNLKFNNLWFRFYLPPNIIFISKKSDTYKLKISSAIPQSNNSVINKYNRIAIIDSLVDNCNKLLPLDKSTNIGELIPINSKDLIFEMRTKPNIKRWMQSISNIWSKKILIFEEEIFFSLRKELWIG